MLLAPAARFRLLSRSLLHIAPCRAICLSDAQSLQMFGQLRVLVDSQDFLKLRLDSQSITSPITRGISNVAF